MKKICLTQSHYAVIQTENSSNKSPITIMTTSIKFDSRYVSTIRDETRLDETSLKGNQKPGHKRPGSTEKNIERWVVLFFSFTAFDIMSAEA